MSAGCHFREFKSLDSRLYRVRRSIASLFCTFLQAASIRPQEQGFSTPERLFLGKRGSFTTESLSTYCTTECLTKTCLSCSPLPTKKISWEVNRERHEVFQGVWGLFIGTRPMTMAKTKSPGHVLTSPPSVFQWSPEWIPCMWKGRMIGQSPKKRKQRNLVGVHPDSEKLTETFS